MLLTTEVAITQNTKTQETSALPSTPQIPNLNNMF